MYIEKEIKMDFDKKTEERIKKIVKARNEALFSLDKEKIKAFMKEYTGIKPENISSETVFWAMVYKAICNIADAPPEVKDKAKAWLNESIFEDEED